MPGIAERLSRVQGRVRLACGRARRDPGSIILVAVSKTRPRQDLLEAFALGLTHFGENRVQEAAYKAEGGLPEGTVLHLVGHLQKNKARAAAGLFRWIHSVDDEELLVRLDAAAAGPIEALAQVDLAGEPTKHGIAPAALPALLGAASGLRQVRLVGLMCLPPYFADPERARPFFRRLCALRDELGGAERLPHLSMGMSHDFEVAVEEGATLLRVGEAIFGRRGIAA